MARGKHLTAAHRQLIVRWAEETTLALTGSGNFFVVAIRLLYQLTG
jgi:hypothetical protein